jgi:hypothetical protein
MESGSNPNPNPFDPNQFKPSGNKVKSSHWTVLILVLVLLVVGGGWLIARKAKRAIGWFHNKKQEVIQGNYGEKQFDTTYAQPYDGSIKTAKLTLNGGTCIYKLSDSTNQLFRADAMLFHSRYALTGNKTDTAYEMNLSMKSKSSTKFGTNSDSVNLKLNLAPVWDIDVNAGATDLDFDLSKYKLRNLNIQGSAGSFKVKAGPPLTQTSISISSAAADITVNIPKNAACRITEKSFLSSPDLDGFIKKDDGSYETAGFASAKNKILIRFSGGVSDIKVNRY